jgi:hypothetical protein
MHWLLKTENVVTLRERLSHSSWFFHPPIYVDPEYRYLFRVERLGEGRTVLYKLLQHSSGIAIQCETELDGDERRFINRRVWRMLCPDNGCAFLRGTTFYEDLLTAQVTVWHPTPDYDNLIHIVDRIGDPLPDNPTLHAFPEPHQIVRSPQSLNQIVGSVSANRVLCIAQRHSFYEQKIEIWLREEGELSLLSSRLKRLLGLSPQSLDVLLAQLGRVDGLPFMHFRGSQSTPASPITSCTTQAT